ncbi:hypothetical protein [Streptomyces mirabilis]|uniref:hypothetical protein n=1 Tax=Streptomyces mirabilis TaxID=68239 RepID=UPI0035D7C34F
MRIRSWKVRLGLTVSTALTAGVAAGALAPAAMAAPMPQNHTAVVAAARQLPADGARPGGGSQFANGQFGTVKVGDGSVRIGDRVCAGNCNGTVNGSNGGQGGICAGLCNGSANGGTGTAGAPGREGGIGGQGGICAGICGGSANGGTGGTGGAAVGTGDGGRGGKGGTGGICLGLGCESGGMGGRGGTGGAG